MSPTQQGPCDLVVLQQAVALRLTCYLSSQSDVSQRWTSVESSSRAQTPKHGTWGRPVQNHQTAAAQNRLLARHRPPPQARCGACGSSAHLIRAFQDGTAPALTNLAHRSSHRHLQHTTPRAAAHMRPPGPVCRRSSACIPPATGAPCPPNFRPTAARLELANSC